MNLKRLVKKSIFLIFLFISMASFSFALSNHQGNVTSSGIFINYTITESATIKFPPIIDSFSLLKKYDVLSSLSAEYSVNVSSSDIANVSFYDLLDGSLLCSSSSSLSSLKSCNNSYLDRHLSGLVDVRVEVCSDFYCANSWEYGVDISKSFYDEGVDIASGIKLSSKYYSPIAETYIPPTPLNGSHRGAQNITIRVYGDATSMTLYFNGTSYPMTETTSNTYEYVVTNLPSQVSELSFYVDTTDGALETRTFTYYPDYSNDFFPGYSLVGVLITLSLLFIFSLSPRKTKKAITPVVTISLLLLVTVSAFVSLSGWYGNFIETQQAKIEYNDVFSSSSEILSIKEEGVYYYLYVKVTTPGYAIIDSLFLGGEECELNEDNVIAQGFSKLRVEGCTIEEGEVYDVVLYSKQDLLDGKTTIKK